MIEGHQSVHEKEQKVGNLEKVGGSELHRFDLLSQLVPERPDCSAEERQRQEIVVEGSRRQEIPQRLERIPVANRTSQVEVGACLALNLNLDAPPGRRKHQIGIRTCE